MSSSQNSIKFNEEEAAAAQHIAFTDIHKEEGSIIIPILKQNVLQLKNLILGNPRSLEQLDRERCTASRLGLR